MRERRSMKFSKEWERHRRSWKRGKNRIKIYCIEKIKAKKLKKFKEAGVFKKALGAC